MVEEQHGVLLVVHCTQRMAVAAGPLGYRLAAEDFQTWRVRRNREGQDEPGVGAPHERGGQGDVGFVADGRGGGELFGPVDDYPVGGFLHHVQRDFRFAIGPGFVLRLLAAVHLRVAQRVGQEQVVLHAVAMVVNDVLAEIAPGMLHLPQRVADSHQADDVRREDVRAATELPPRFLIPDFAVAPLPLQVFMAARQQPRRAAPVPGVRGDEGHIILILLRMLQVVDAGQLVHHAGQRRMAGHVVNLRSVQPDFPTVTQAGDVAGAGHGALGRLDF